MFPIKLFLSLIITAAICFSVFCDDAPTAAVDYDGLMAMCNKTYQVNLDALKQLNYTGILPDETNNVPMCFVKCFMESLGMITDGKMWVKEKVAIHLWPKAEETVEPCQQELQSLAMSDSVDLCMLAYKMISCMIKRRNVSWGISQ